MLKSSKEEIQPLVRNDEKSIHSSSFLGPNIRFEGELSGQENVTIQGHVKGKIQLHQNTLIVEENGNIQADVQAGQVIIRGKVKGNILASGKVTISKAGSMTGEIASPRISIEDGAHFKGSVKMDIKSPEALQSGMPDTK